MKKVRRTESPRFSLFGQRRKRRGGPAYPRRRAFRPLNSERLEERALLAANVVSDGPQFESPLAAYEFMYSSRAFSPANPDHNWQKAADVDGNGRIESYDLLKVIGPLREGSRQLGASTAEGEDAASGGGLGYIDVNGDRYLSITDALGVVQALRAEGEPGDVVAIMPSISAAGPITVGGTYTVSVGIEDLRTEDPNPNNFDPNTGNPIEDRGVFAAVTDLMYNPDLSGIPLAPFLSANAAATHFGTTYANGDLSVLDQRVGEGKIRINGAVANLLNPPGPGEFVFANIPFKVGAIPDFVTTPEETAVTIDVLGNDTSQSGTQTVMTNFVNAQGQVVLLFVQSDANENNNGQGVAEEDIMFASDTVQVSVPGAPTLSGITSQPSNGTATITGGQIQYTPATDFFGTDTFTYTISYPGGVTDTASVTVTVTNVPDDPVANDDMYTTAANVLLTDPAPGVLENDTDPDIDPNLSPNNPRNDRITITDSDDTSAQGAAVTVNADGSFTYDPTGVTAFASLGVGETVVDTFTYTISDKAGATDTATVSVTVTGVNDPPVAVDDPFEVEQINGVFQTLDVLANDSDPDDDTLTVTAVTQGNQGGTVEIAPGAAAVRYRHTAGFVGTETFTYTISDGNGGTDTATVTVDVVAQALRAVDDTATADEQGPPIDIPVTQNDRTEVDDQGGTPEDYNTRIISVNGQTGNGPFTLPSGATVEVIPGATFAETVIRYTPPQADPGFVGLDTFTYTIDDDTSEGIPDPDPDPNQPSTATVRVTVVNVDQDGIVANDDPIATPVPGNQVFTLPAPGVLANDTDPDLDTITAVAETKTSAQGAAVTINADGSFSYDPRNAAAIRALAAGQTLTDTFIYTVVDDGTPQATDTATVTLTVQGVNDPPDATNATRQTDEDTVLTGDLRDFVTDPDTGDSLTFTPPTITTSLGASVTINANGTFSYDPRGASQLQALQVGEQLSDTFQYTARDAGGLTDSATLTVTVTGVNDPPNAVDDNFTIDQNRGVFQRLTGALNPLANDTDIDGDPLTITGLGASNQTSLTLSTGSVVRIASDGVIEYQNNGFDGTESFTYTISDGNGGTDTATIMLNIVAFVPSTISGFVYIDKDNDGAKDSDEVGLANVTVTLTGTDINGAAVSRTTLTDSSGRYQFTNLPPNGSGGYRITVGQIPFMIDGQETASISDDSSITGGPVPPGLTATVTGDRQITINLPSLGDVASQNNNFSVRGLSLEHVSLADVIAYGNEYPQVGLAAVGSAGVNFLAVPGGSGWAAFSMPTFTLNGNGTVTIHVRRLSDNAQLSATVPLNTPLNGTTAQVKVMGTDGQGNTLLKFNGSPASFGFAPVAGGEGEQGGYAQAADAVFAEGF